MATENIKLLETEKGTHMFVCITNRIKMKCFCKEVIYQGFEIHTVKRSYEEPGKVKYTEWEEPEYHLEFSLLENPYTIFSVLCRYTGNLVPHGGVRHFDTDEHLEYGASFKCDDPEPDSILSSLNTFGCLDIYFTTDRDKFVKYLNDNDILNSINLQLQCIKDMISDIESFVKPDSSGTEHGVAETGKYKIIESQYRGKYAAGLAENKQWVKYILMRFECGYILSDIYFNDHRYDVIDDYDEYDNFKKEWPSIYDKETDTIWLKIDVSDGTVVNWPEGKTADFDTVKLVDGGTYEMYDAEDTLIAHYKGYVPEILSINTKGWGDYLEFNIGPDRKIINWSFDSMDKYNEFMRNCGALED